VLIAAGAVPSDLTAVAVCTGPGSFTGLRVGIAAARGFAMGLGVPAIGITRFEALAAGHDGPVAVVLRGRQQTVYLQMFDAAGVAAGPATMLSVNSLPSVIPSGLPVIGDHGPLAGPALADPATVARLAQGRGAGPLPAPLYLRGPDADLPRTAPPAILVP
jgi:tRNA threonylcarbamoyl adenosine modification protein YeaZ